MIEYGVQIRCNGCGCATFMEKPVAIPLDNPYHVDVHVHEYNENQSDSWGRVHAVLDLCPRCLKIHEKMLCEFYERCGEARDDELYIIPKQGEENDQT